MTTLIRDSAVTQTVALLTRYSFEIQGYTAQEIVTKWLTKYSTTWIRLAVVEALYLGRYKAVSVEQILSCWFRLGNPKIHFDREFECLICCNLPQSLSASLNTDNSSRNKPGSQQSQYRLSHSQRLNRTRREPSVTSAIQPNRNLSRSAVSKALSPSSDNEDAPSTPKTPSAPKTPPARSERDSKQTIGRFTPSPDVSQFYFKLKAVAQHPVE